MQLGCDPVELERLVPRCRAASRAPDRTSARLARSDPSGWTGPAAQRFWSTLREELRPQLLTGSTVLRSLGDRLQRHADEQRRASLAPVHTSTVRSVPAAAGSDARWVGRTGTHDADLVVVLVPGVGTDVGDRGELQRDARRLHTELAVLAERSRRPVGAVRGAHEVAVVSWLGYDPPDHLLAGLARSPAVAGASQLSADVAAWRADGARRVVVVGHSYGALVASRAAASGMGVDELVLLGAPGLGVDHVDRLALDDGAELWVAAAERDPISWLARVGLVHGPDPAGAGRSLPTSLSGHSAYLDDPVLLAELARLATQDRLRA